MKVKTKSFLTGAIFIALMVLLLLFVVFTGSPTTASAATNSSAIYVTNGKIENSNGQVISDAPKDNYKVTMQSANASGSGTLDSNAVIDWTYAIIKVEVTKISKHHNFTLQKDGLTIAGSDLSGKASVTLWSGSLSNGNYTLTYVSTYTIGNAVYQGFRYVYRFVVDNTAPTYQLKSGDGMIASGSNTAKSITYSASDPHFSRLYYKSPTASSYSSTTYTSYSVDARADNSGWWYFYASDTLGQKSETVKVYLDCKPPQMTCSNGASFGSTVGKSFTITASDEVSTAKLYVKFESEEWFSSGSSYTIPDTERNGRYYFYAEDGNGNRSETSWIVLSTEEPSGSLIKSESDNSVSFVWNNEYWSATLDGTNYAEGKIISNEGQHEIILSNNAYKTKTYKFSIEHFYKMVSQIPSTCFENGVKKFECSQCGNTYEEIEYTSGHRYNIISTPSTCTESEHIVYQCSLCGDRYETEGNYPTGHNYVSTVTIEPTCTTEGQRLVKCENCGDEYTVTIAANGHNYEITDTTTSNGKTTRTYTCTVCGHSYKQELGDQYEEVSNYVEYLFEQYSPYMWWVLLAAAGVWSIVMGVFFAIAQKNEDKEKSKKMIINYAIGLVVIAVIVVACPYLIRGIAALVT